jgi:hypothetical protein
MVATNCHSVLGTVGIRAPTTKVRECSAFSVSLVLRRNPPATFSITANDIYRLKDTFGRNSTYFEDIFSIEKIILALIILEPG